MSEICKIDTHELDNILNNLNEENRRKALFTSITKGGQELVKETQSELLKVLPKANDTGRYGKMINGVKLKKDKSYDEVKVHIMGDFRLKFFEMGTEERYLKKPLKQKENTRYKYKSGTNNSGGNPYRGKIQAKYFFQKARENSKMIDTLINTLEKEINKLFKK